MIRDESSVLIICRDYINKFWFGQQNPMRHILFIVDFNILKTLNFFKKMLPVFSNQDIYHQSHQS